MSHQSTRLGRRAALRLLLLVALLVLVAVGLPAQAQSGGGYDLSWGAVGGGGTSNRSAGPYTWGGTVGQPDSGALIGGRYTLQGGFWGGVFTPTPYQSTQSGEWGTGGTWDRLTPPGYNAVTTIRAGDTVTVSGAAQCYRLVIEHGGTLALAEGATLAVRDSVSNAGTLQQTRAVDGSGGTVRFLMLGDYRGVDLTTSNNLGAVTVTVRALAGGEYCTATGAASPPYARRCFRIQPDNNHGALVRLWALASEVAFVGTPAVYHNPGGSGTWTELTTGAVTGTSGDYTYAEAETPGFSHFLMAASGSAPTSVSLRALSASAGGGVNAVTLFGLVAGIGALLFIQARRQKGGTPYEQN